MNNSLMPPRAWRIAPPAIGGRRGLLLIKIFWDSIFCRWRGLPDSAGGAGAPLPVASPARSAIPGARGGAMLVRVPLSLVPCRPVRARAHRCIAPLTSIALKPPPASPQRACGRGERLGHYLSPTGGRRDTMSAPDHRDMVSPLPPCGFPSACPPLARHLKRAPLRRRPLSLRECPPLARNTPATCPPLARHLPATCPSAP